METIIKLKLKGGLNNKLIRFQNIIEIAIENNLRIREPEFGWPHRNKSEKFSNLFDLRFFNKSIEKCYGVKDFIISSKYYFEHINQYEIKKIKFTNHSIDYLYKNQSFEIKKNVMGSLKPSEKLSDYIKSGSTDDITAVQLRIESDWQKWNKLIGEKMKKKSDEKMLVTQSEFIKIFEKSKIYSTDIFFTTGENHDEVKSKFEKNNINCNFFYDKSLGYETNSVINFFMCINAKKFIGLTRSTFSQNVFFCRFLNGNCNSYFYNFQNKINLKKCDVHSLSGSDMNPERFMCLYD